MVLQYSCSFALRINPGYTHPAINNNPINRPIIMAIKISSRAVIIALMALSWVFFIMSPLQAQLPLETSEDTLTRYQDYSRIYYQIKSLEFSTEIIPLEKYLIHLLDGVNCEISKRNYVTTEALDFLSSQEISHMAVRYAGSEKDNYFARKYEYWKQYQMNELYLQIDRALRIKKRLFDDGISEHQQRMFKRDLEAACRVMGEGELGMSIMLYQHMIEFYGYENIDDLIYYLSEAYYQSKQYIAAEAGFNRLMMEYPQSDYFEPALYRCISLSYNRGDHEITHQLYSIFERRGEDNWEYKNDVIYFIESSVSFQEGGFERSLRIFSKISADSEYYRRARYFSGQCLSRLGRLEEAVEQFAWVIETKKGTFDALFEESAIASGDILVAMENWDDGWGYYRLINEMSPKLPRALIGQGVCRLLRGEYDMADSLADSVIGNYGNTRYIFMARNLKARCRQKMGDLKAAEEQYSVILEQSGIKIDLVNYHTEKLKVIYLLNELRNGEEEALATGDVELFNDYWALRKDAERLLKRLIFTEIKEAEPEFGGFIEEKLKVIKLMEDFTALTDDVLKLRDLKLVERYQDFQEELLDLNTMVTVAGYGRLQKLPNYFTVTENDFSKAALDSLYRATSKELNDLEEDLIAASTALADADEGTEPEDRFAMLETVNSIREWRRELDLRLSGTVKHLGVSEELDLTRWSHIAFHKSMVAGLDFEDLKERQRRIKEIDKYLQALGNIVFKLGLNLREEQ